MVSYLKENPFKDCTKVYSRKMDLTVSEEVNEFCSCAKELCSKNKLKAIVNNAGIAMAGTVENTTLDIYQEVFDVNYFGVVAVTKTMIPELIKTKGRIVVIGSFAGRIAMPFFSPYASSKFALEGFCDSLRREMIPFGVKTILIEPAAVATPIWNKGKEQDISFIDDKYKKCFLDARDSFIKGGNAGMHPDKAAAIISKVLAKRNPRSRYLISIVLLKQVFWQGFLMLFWTRRLKRSIKWIMESNPKEELLWKKFQL